MWRNCTVWLAGMTMSLGAIGCVVEENDGPSNGYSGGYNPGGPAPVVSGAALRIRWDVAFLDGKLTECDVTDTPTVNLEVTLRATGDRFTASFPCEAGGGLVSDLPPGTYDVALDLLDRHNRPVSSLDYPGLPAFTGSVSEPEDVAVFPVQVWDMTWTLAVATPGGLRTATCGDVGATTVQVSTQRGGEAPEVYTLPCADYGALSTAIRPGNYSARMVLIDGRGRLMADTGPGSFAVTFDAPAFLDADFTL
jgi:hypothetical protein